MKYLPALILSLLLSSAALPLTAATPDIPKAAEKAAAVPALPALYNVRIPDNTATHAQHRLRTAWWAKRFKENQQAAKTPHDTVLIGDSITHNWDRKAPDLEKKYFGDALNMGFSGDQTSHVLWRIRRIDWKSLNPKRIMLMIGTNNSGTRPKDDPKEIYWGVLAILRHLRQACPEADILLIRILPRAKSLTDARRVRNEKANAMFDAFAADPKVTIKDISALFLTKDGHINTALMPDCLHPNHEGHRLWAEAVVKEFMQMGQTKDTACPTTEER